MSPEPRFLERLGFQPVILHEQANLGRTVIEKVEAHSEVGFAIVLLTPDDQGNLVGEQPRPRARQNVLLELGYFIGKLTRQRVCTLKVGDLEIPSDWRGVIDEPFDSGGGWKQTLARELDAAGYEIDWNRVMR
jgi:predicted nucleotide-binding protein